MFYLLNTYINLLFLERPKDPKIMMVRSKRLMIFY